MKITAVHVDTLELAMEEPFVIASSALSIGPCDLVRVETDEGITGIGEACPAYEFTGDTLWTVEDVIGEYLAPAVIGRDPFDIEGIHRVWERELYTVGNQAARAGLEIALWDLQGKALGRPLHDLVGGRSRPALQEVVAFGWEQPETLAAKTRAMKAEGIHIFKIKVGDAPERDEQRVAAVREAAARTRASPSTPTRGGGTPRRPCAPSSSWSATASSSPSSRCAWTTSMRRGSFARTWTCPSRWTRACAALARRSPAPRPKRATCSW